MYHHSQCSSEAVSAVPSPRGLRVARDMYRQPTPFDHQSDLGHKLSVISLPYHFEHYAHNSLTLYSPGGFEYVDHDSDLLDPSLYQTGSTENDVSPVQSLVTDSVLTQEQGVSGGLGDVPRGRDSSDSRRRDIEQGRIDYMGRDRFENIARYIDAVLQSGPQGGLQSDSQEDQS